MRAPSFLLMPGPTSRVPCLQVMTWEADMVYFLWALKRDTCMCSAIAKDPMHQTRNPVCSVFSSATSCFKLCVKLNVYM